MAAADLICDKEATKARQKKKPRYVKLRHPPAPTRGAASSRKRYCSAQAPSAWRPRRQIISGDLRHGKLARSRYPSRMAMLRLIPIWICQCLLFLPGIGIAQLCAELGSHLVVRAFPIDETLPKAVIFFGTAALLGWIGNRHWPEHWRRNPLL